MGISGEVAGRPKGLAALSSGKVTENLCGSGGYAATLGPLLEADRADLEAEGLPRLAVVTGEEVDNGQLAELGRSDLQDRLGLRVHLFGLKNRGINEVKHTQWFCGYK